MRIIYTEAIDAHLKQLWADGVSARDCAPILSRMFNLEITRSAVLGRVHRLVLPARIHSGEARRAPVPKGQPKLRTRTPRTPRQIRDFELVEALLKDPDALRPPLESGRRRTFSELEPGHCRWPYGDPRIHDSYCPNNVLKMPSESGGLYIYSYCAHHCDVAYGWSQPSCKSKMGLAYRAACGCAEEKAHAHV